MFGARYIRMDDMYYEVPKIWLKEKEKELVDTG